MKQWSTLKKLIWIRMLQAASAIVKTVTGALPLVLSNAINHAIVSLTRYGLCTQDGTPTPDAPVDIVCNNGALRMVDDELPSGYKRLLGISFDGNFHYKTYEYLTGDDVVTMTLNNLSSSGKNVFGSYNGANSKNFSLYVYGSTSGSYFRFGDQLKRPKYGDTGRRTITFGAGGTSGFADDSTVDPDEFVTQANTYIGMLPNSSSAAYSGDIIGSITVSNRLEWIPCENDGGVIGYYERVNGNFIAPTGNGTPVSLGYDTSHLVLRVVGDPEVLKVSASGAADQTAAVPMLLSVGDYADEAELISGGVTRKVGIKVFDGTETVNVSSAGNAYTKIDGVAIGAPNTPINTHFALETSTTSLTEGRARFGANGTTIYSSNYYMSHPTARTAADFKAWLASEYANGTPVIVLYPLATETTEQTTAQHLNTTEGTNIIDSTSNVSPIDVEVEYAAKKGA